MRGWEEVRRNKKLMSSQVEGLKSSVGGGELGGVAESGGRVFFGGDFPGRGVGEEAADKLGVE